MEAHYSCEAGLTQCTGVGEARLLLQLGARSSNKQLWRFQREESSTRQGRGRELRHSLPSTSALARHQKEAPDVHCKDAGFMRRQSYIMYHLGQDLVEIIKFRGAVVLLLRRQIRQAGEVYSWQPRAGSLFV